jgi:hypothetical protein
MLIDSLLDDRKQEYFNMKIRSGGGELPPMLVQSSPKVCFEEVEPHRLSSDFGEDMLTGTGMVLGGTL